MKTRLDKQIEWTGVHRGRVSSIFDWKRWKRTPPEPKNAGEIITSAEVLNILRPMGFRRILLADEDRRVADVILLVECILSHRIHEIPWDPENNCDNISFAGMGAANQTTRFLWDHPTCKHFSHFRKFEPLSGMAVYKVWADVLHPFFGPKMVYHDMMAAIGPKGFVWVSPQAGQTIKPTKVRPDLIIGN